MVSWLGFWGKQNQGKRKDIGTQASDNNMLLNTGMF